ncbi:MAG: twin-arginine translocase subunit TatC [Desulfovibrionaceae bacterium]|nr:twin-arginine translocase subunit TatC [Desulfovibrionaceae bacterium]
MKEKAQEPESIPLPPVSAFSSSESSAAIARTAVAPGCSDVCPPVRSAASEAEETDISVVGIDAGPVNSALQEEDSALPSSQPPSRTDSGNAPHSENKVGLLEHLRELRARLIRCLAGWGLLFLICWVFDRELGQIILSPVQQALAHSGGRLITITLPEGFLAYLNISLVASLFFSSPWLFYQAWAFAAPGLRKSEKKRILPLAFASAFLFCLGALFAYFVIFPAAFNFLIAYAGDAASPEPSLRFYLSLALNTLLAFGFAFQMPLAIFFLAGLGVVTPAGLRRRRRFAILGAFIVGAVLTPPDPVSQILMALPLIGLYELSVFVCSHAHYKRALLKEEENRQ